MLNIFPLQWLALYAYFLLRLWVGTLLLYLGLTHSSFYRQLVTTTTWPLLPHHPLPIILMIGSEYVFGVILLTGAYTQLVVLGIFFLALKILIWRHRFTHSSLPDRWFYFLLLGCCLSLFITGGGAIAFDLPI